MAKMRNVIRATALAAAAATAGAAQAQELDFSEDLATQTVTPLTGVSATPGNPVFIDLNGDRIDDFVIQVVEFGEDVQIDVVVPPLPLTFGPPIEVAFIEALDQSDFFGGIVISPDEMLWTVDDPFIDVPDIDQPTELATLFAARFAEDESIFSEEADFFSASAAFLYVDFIPDFVTESVAPEGTDTVEETVAVIAAGPFARPQEPGVNPGFIGLSLFDNTTEDVTVGFAEISRGSVVVSGVGVQNTANGTAVTQSSVNVVPLPAGVWMMLGALGLLGVFGARRRAA